ncbi:MAG: T9SS type A sorting domain-containing protein [Bacteroidota bacterium]
MKKNESASKSTTTANWTSLGPVTIPSNGGGAGRINCIAFYPDNPTIMFAGSPSGGLWKSTDAGNSWSTNTDLLPNIGVSGIAIDPINPDIMYIATGDGDAGDTYTIGVLKSIDGGMTWNTTGLTYNVSQMKSVRKLLIHPINTDTLFAATNAGIYRSPDAGNTWTNVRSGNFYDIEFKPGDPSVIWGATFNRIYKSTNSGTIFLICSAFSPDDVARLSIAVTANDPDYLYILGGNNIDYGLAGVWKTTDLGLSFTLCADSPNMLGWTTGGTDSGGQGWYDLAIAASPANKNTVFIGGVNIWKTTDGGTNWSLNAHWYGGDGKPYVHADIHAIEFVPVSGSNIYAGCDGGVFKTTNTGGAWTDKSSTLSIAQMYRLGCSATDPDLVITGWQDNGSNLYNNSAWSNVIGGDGMECMIDYSAPNYVYGEIYYGDMYRSDNGGISWNSITDDITEEGDWITPYIQDPQNPQTIYAGFCNLWRSDNRGDSWTKLSDFIGSNKITAIAVASSNTDVIYISRSGVILKSTDGGTNFANASVGLPSLTPTYIAVSPVDPEVLWISLSGYYNGYKVFTSRNGGATWTNFSGSLPNIPANTIVMETASDEGLYLGTDLGVFYRDSTMADWISYNTGLPNVVIDELEIHYGSGKLRAATYGRGLWETDLYSVVGTGNDFTLLENKMDIFPNPSSGIINIYLSCLQENESAELIIFNSIGAIVYSKKFTATSGCCISADMDNKPQGLYVIKVRTAQHIFSGTFVKI